MDWVELELVDNCVVDNHHSPMKPMQYIHARLVPMLNFYQSRLSHKSVEWQTTTFFMLLATTSITILSFLSSDGRDLTGPAGVVAALMAAGCVAERQRSGQKDAPLLKLDRLHQESYAVRPQCILFSCHTLLRSPISCPHSWSLPLHCRWWDSLTPVDRKSQAHINRLVNVGEEINLQEIKAWSDASHQEEENDHDGSEAGTTKNVSA